MALQQMAKAQQQLPPALAREANASPLDFHHQIAAMPARGILQISVQAQGHDP